MLHVPEGLGSIPLDLGWNVRWAIRSAVGEAEIGLVSTVCEGIAVSSRHRDVAIFGCMPKEEYMSARDHIIRD